MKVLFAASPAIAIPSLKALCNINDIELVGVLTNPDTAKGRSGALLPTEVGEAAEELLAVSNKKFTILKPFKLDADAREQVAALKPDLLVSFAYGRLFGPKFLSLFPLGGINIHPSLLPKYRGPSPIQAAILNRDTETGISIQTLAQEMDSGDIIDVKYLQIMKGETTLSLSQRVSQEAALMLPDIFIKLKDIIGFASDALSIKNALYSAGFTVQNNSDASYCKLFSRKDAVIDWKKSALEIDAAVRAFNPPPFCRTIHKEKELLILEACALDDFAQVDLQRNGNLPTGEPGKVLGTDENYGILIQTGDGILAVTKLQYQNKKAHFWRDFLNGALEFPGSQLG